MPENDMSEKDRERLGARLKREQLVRFHGIAKDAYTAAGVNSATWTRATTGETIKPHKLIQIVVAFWPETEGDWRKVPDLHPGSSAKFGSEADELRAVLRAAQDAGLTRDDVLEILDSETA